MTNTVGDVREYARNQHMWFEDVKVASMISRRGHLLCKRFLVICAAAIGITLSAIATPIRFVTYIESNGSQYIDLGVTASGSIRAEATVAWTGAPHDESLIGVREGDFRCYLIHNANSHITYGYGVYKHADVDARTEPFVVYDIVSDFQPGYQFVNIGGETVGKYNSDSTLGLNGNLYLFACNYENVASYKASARVYRLKIWKDNTLVLDLRPCVSGGVAGLYDLKSGNFLTKVTGDALVAGPDYVEDRPEMFLSYIDSDSTQYVDTGVLGMNGVKGELDVTMWKVDNDVTMMGSYGDNRFYLIHSFNGRLTYGHNNDFPKDSTFRLQRGMRYTISGEMDIGLQRLCSDDQIVFTSNSTARVTRPRSIYLWACHGANGAMYQSTMRLYRAKIWQHGELVRDYVPCICKKRIGLFDQINRRFVTSSTPFTVSGCGQITNIVEGTRPEHFLEYVANNGSTQCYVATDVRAESGIGMRTTMMWDEVPVDASYLAARKGNNLRFYSYHYYGSHMLGYGDYAPYQTDITAIAGVQYRICSFLDTGRQELVVNRLNEGIWEQEVSLLKETAGMKDTELTLYLFGCNKDGSMEYPAKARCYSLQIYKNGMLVRDYLPVDYIGIPMLWDRINCKMYPSAGSKHLIGGPILSDFYLNSFKISIR